MKDPDIVLVDEKPNRCPGGSSQANVWTERMLNTVQHDPGRRIVLSHNSFTLQPGHYQISFEAPAFKVGEHQSKLESLTKNHDVCMGNKQMSDVGNTTSHGAIELTLTEPEVFNIQHRCQKTHEIVGLGAPHAGPNTPEEYTCVKIWVFRE